MDHNMNKITLNFKTIINYCTRRKTDSESRSVNCKWVLIYFDSKMIEKKSYENAVFSIELYRYNRFSQTLSTIKFEIQPENVENMLLHCKIRNYNKRSCRSNTIVGLFRTLKTP